MRAPVLVVAVLLLTGVVGGYRPAAMPHQPPHHPPYRLADVRVSHIGVVGDSYTTGSNEGGRGPQGWLARTEEMLDRAGRPVATSVAAEGRAGYGAPGEFGSLFADLAARAVRPDTTLVVFFGSRNDAEFADPNLLAGHIRDAFDVAHRAAPAARLLVIGPPWPTGDVPDTVLRVRDILAAESVAAQADFVDPLAEGWFVGRPDLIGGDGVHPTDAGHAYLAERIEPLISARLPA